MDSEEFWFRVGDAVNTHFLYNTILTKDIYNSILKNIRTEEKSNYISRNEFIRRKEKEFFKEEK